MFSLLKSGGILIIPIILCGLAATYIIIERCIYFLLMKKKNRVFLYSLNEALARKDYSLCEELCSQTETPFSKVVFTALKMRNLDEKHLEEIVEAELESVIPELEHFLTILGTIAGISTLLGLFGTVTGNIKAFGVLGEGASMGNPAVLAGAIAEALVTTAAGLFVAIPSTIFSNYFNRRVNKEIAAMEKEITKILLKISGRI